MLGVQKQFLIIIKTIFYYNMNTMLSANRVMELLNQQHHTLHIPISLRYHSAHELAGRWSAIVINNLKNYLKINNE